MVVDHFSGAIGALDVDHKEEIEAWVAAVQSQLLPKLSGDKRLVNGEALINRFLHEIDVWHSRGRFQPVIEFGNELAAAEQLLRLMKSDESLHYEPPMAGTQKRLDFLCSSPTGERAWFEVKTIAPTWVDDEDGWARFMRIAQSFPENAQLVVEKEWAGAALSGQAIKARWSFIRYTAEIEKRSIQIPDELKGPVWALYCSTGTNWHLDELEDFADFYRTGVPRTDDWMRNAVERFMNEEGISFSRSLSGFHYLAREHHEVSAHDFRRNVSGPEFGR